MSTPVLLDTQLLVLLAIGLTDINLIKKHKGVRGYTEDDYLLLLSQLGVNYRLILLPNIVSETANFLRQHRDPERSQVMEAFAKLVKKHKEHFVRSRDVVDHQFYLPLGIADSAILKCCHGKYEILTADLDLFLASQHLEISVTNFNHLREDYGIV